MNELDPLGLHLPHQARHSGMARYLGFRTLGHDIVVQVALISETNRSIFLFVCLFVCLFIVFVFVVTVVGCFLVIDQHQDRQLTGLVLRLSVLSNSLYYQLSAYQILLPYRLQSILATHGIPSQTQKEVEPIKIKAPSDVLMKVRSLEICHLQNNSNNNIFIPRYSSV